MKIDLKELKQDEVYTTVLYALYKIRDDPNYTLLSELVYLLDRKSFLKLCEYFGGMTIRIPTISELEDMMIAILLYKYVNIDGMDESVAKKKLDLASTAKSTGLSNRQKHILNLYSQVKELIGDYNNVFEQE